jgi:hypothetical protein
VNLAVEHKAFVIHSDEFLQQDIDMLAETSIELEARNPMANRLRKWCVELSQD